MFRSSQKNKNKSDNRHTISDLSRLKSSNNDEPDLDDLQKKSSLQFAFTEKINFSNSSNLICEDEENFVSPSVRVKHSVAYEYDEKKFKIQKDEFLFLINKTNQDWWLCLRLDENLTFFVPASYLQELEIRPQPNLIPPPRPPPPPPSSGERKSTESTRSNAAITAAAAVAAVTATTPASTFSDYSSDSSKFKKPEVKQRQLFNYSNTMNNLTPSINNTANDDSYSLNRLSSTFSIITQSNEEFSPMIPGEANDSIKEKNLIEDFTDDSAESIINDLDECLNKEEDSLRKRDKEDIYTTVATFRKDIENKDEKDHIYENYPVLAPRANNITNRKAILRTSDEFEEENDPDIVSSINNSATVSNVQEPIINKKNTESISSQINEELEAYLDEEESSKSDDDLLESDLIKAPRGWKIAIESYSRRKYFFNEKNDEKWFITYDSNKKPYFYNTDGKSVWELDEILVNEQSDDQHFRKNFDEDLGTFNNIYNRLSVRQVSNESSNLSVGSIYPNLSCALNDDQSKTPNNRSNNSTSQLHRVSTGLNSNFKCVKLTEKGKKCKKKTVENFRVELASTNLLFIKETKGVDKLEFPIDFKGGKCYKVDIPKNSSPSSNSSGTNKDSNNNPSKNEKIKLQLKIGKKDKDIEELVEFIGTTKAGFVIETLTGYKILLIHESETLVIDWVAEINTIMHHNKNVSSPLNHLYDRSQSEHETSLSSRIQPVSKNSKKECVYGANLLSLCQREQRIVPVFVEEIIKEIENKGLDMDGIYRISGNLAEVQKVRHQVDQGKHNFKDFDIHVLCGAFKTFFRELEEPLIPLNLHEDFLYSITIADQNKRFENIEELIKRLPMPNRETMRHLCQHLLKVVEKSSENRMTVQNVALVFGPNIIRSNPVNDTNNGFNPNIMTQNILVEYILKNFKDLFSYSPTTVFYDETF